jgi:hypothetical protein
MLRVYEKTLVNGRYVDFYQVVDVFYLAQLFSVSLVATLVLRQ